MMCEVKVDVYEFKRKNVEWDFREEERRDARGR
jgi:hypothetical protein